MGEGDGWQGGRANGMARYLVRRLLWTVVLFFGITLVAFVLFKLVPSDPALLAAGPNATSDQVERARFLLELDEPSYLQYWHFLQRLVVDHSLGTSFSGREVTDIVFTAAPVSASVVVGGMLLWLSISVPVGILSALRPRSLGDRAGRVFVLVGVSLHPLVLGLLLAYVFGYRLGWTPITGYCTFVTHRGQLCGGPTEWFVHLILPWITFSVLYAALYVRMIRTAVLEALAADFVMTARAKGAGTYATLRSHVLRNAMLPIVTMVGMDLGVALGGTVFVEIVFGMPGLGRALVAGATGHDIAVTEGIVVILALVVLTLNLIVDLAYMLIDPRVRLAD